MAPSSAEKLEEALRDLDRRSEAERVHPELRRARLKREFVRGELLRWAVLAALLLAAWVILERMIQGSWKLPYPVATDVWFAALIGMLFVLIGLGAIVTWSRYRTYQAEVRAEPG